MPKANPPINSLNGGEVSKLIEERTDISKYSSCCRKLENAFPLIEGGVKKMPGTYYAGSTKFPGQKARLVPFSFNATQQYILEFGEQYIRFWKNGGLILNPYPAGSVLGTSTSSLSIGTGAISFFTSNGATGAIVKGDVIKLVDTANTANTMTGTVTLAVMVVNPSMNGLSVVFNVTSVTGSGGPFTSWNIVQVTGSQYIEVSTPYYEADLFSLDINSQSADELYIFHANYPPATVNRTSDTSWTYAPFLAYGWVQTVVPSTAQVFISNITVGPPAQVTTFTAHGLISGMQVYLNGLLGENVGLNKGRYAISIIDSYNFTLTGVTGGSPFTAGGYMIGVDQLFTTSGDYPACGCFFQQRLLVGGSTNKPQTVLGTVIGDFTNFTPDPNEDDYGINFTLASGRVDVIRWMVAQTYVLIGTAGGVWAMCGGQIGSPQPLTQTSVDAVRQTTTGVGNIAPKIINDTLIWVTRSVKTVRLIQYDFVSNAFSSPDLTRLNRDITKGLTQALSGIVQTAFQAEPYPILWCVRADGQLIGLTYEKNEQVFAWFRVVTDGIVESVSVISADNSEDQVWIIANRTINAQTVRCVEYFGQQEIYNTLANAFFVHCGLQWQGAGPFNIAGITNANPCVVNAPGNTFQNGQEVTINDVQGMTQINLDPSSSYTVSNAVGDFFSLQGIDSTGWGAYTSGGTAQQVTNTVTGLTYLLGMNVVAVGDGARIYDGIITADSLTFGYYCNLITVGLPYATTIEPLNPILGNQQQTSKGQKQKITRITLSLCESVGGQYGRNSSELYDMLYGEGSEGQAPELFTGSIERDLFGEWEESSTICISHSDPFPFTLRAIIPEIDISPRT